jgi:hypothetical protein
MLRKGSHNRHEFFGKQHRFEHWYRDNTIYFITARCRHRTAAFATEVCQSIFWDRFNHYTSEFGFTPILTSLLDNHYHSMGHLRIGTNLGLLMQKLHGSVTKLVNDQLPDRLTPFWTDSGHQNYFDGGIRDATQFRRAYGYTLTQCRRHGICADPVDYPHTRVCVNLDRALKRALAINAFLENIPYKRYTRRRP